MLMHKNILNISMDSKPKKNRRGNYKKSLYKLKDLSRARVFCIKNFGMMFG